MGAWYLRDPNRPYFVGYSLETLVGAIRGGEVGMNAIIRGPTTRQFWTIARRVPGIAHLFGRCFACQAPVSEREPQCAACGAAPPPAIDRNHLGLPPVERVAPPADARHDFSAFIEDSSMLLVRAAPHVEPKPLPSVRPQFVAGAVQASAGASAVDPEPLPASAPACELDRISRAGARAGLSPLQIGLFSRIHALERNNRLFLGLAVISFLVAIGLVIALLRANEHFRREGDARVEEAVRSIRSEFERRTPVTAPLVPEVPNAPEPPSAGAGSPQSAQPPAGGGAIRAGGG